MLASPAFPHCWLEIVIQLHYFTYFGSIWEYQKEFDSIDWLNVLKDIQKGACPICTKLGCRLRQINPYPRRVIELLPVYREGVIFVPRFICRSKKTTLSLLPFQLAPYRRYTIASILFALLVAERCAREQGWSLFSVAEKEIEENSGVNGCTLGSWLTMTVSSFRCNHDVLRKSYKLDSLIPGDNQAGRLFEVAGYCKALGIRGPPSIGESDAAIKIFVRTTGRFLIGVASQHRRGTGES